MERLEMGFGPYAMVLPPSRILAPIWALLKTCFAGRQNVLRALSVFSKVVCAPSQLVLMHGEWGGERELEREREAERTLFFQKQVCLLLGNDTKEYLLNEVCFPSGITASVDQSPLEIAFGNSEVPCNSSDWSRAAPCWKQHPSCLWRSQAGDRWVSRVPGGRFANPAAPSRFGVGLVGNGFVSPEN